MAGLCYNSESDDEPLNLHLFVRKSFGFEGLPKEKDIKLRSVVQGLGATCDDLPKYVFTTSEYFLSSVVTNSPLYNITYIRDCIDANRCLSIDQYRFGPKYVEKKDFREFDPCCHNFHNGNNACVVCDPTFKKADVSAVKEKKVKEKVTKLAAVENNIATKKVKTKSCTMKESTPGPKSQLVNRVQRNWEPWEHRLLLDYIIGHNLFAYCKGPSLYKRMVEEGFLNHRTPESMRVQFRTTILNSIDSFNLPKPILRKFKKIRALKVNGSYQLQKMFGKKNFRSCNQ
ncbi:uncharacterized protein LOC106644468 isoform X2 [Copidosoma floridanum]|uniref:uncharacterized protein LOC106644468 isoform X2 n=1 Tax=Copidosoma floridanum TaxID=29053 RepID=UPI0006C950A4|nr:uncharacterized protein LOC106644468 isoform X2 [Copidosoma floridanum]